MPEKKEIKPGLELDPGFEWARRTSRYSNGSDCKCGNFKIGSTEWGSSGGYNAGCSLPGMKNLLGNYKNEGDAKERVEYAAKYWLSKLNIKVTERNPDEISPDAPIETTEKEWSWKSF